jgi:hypothetical protein
MEKFFRTLALSASMIFVFFVANNAYAQGKYFNISLQGSYQRNYSEFSTFTRTAVGGDIGIPFTDFLELTVGHNLRMDKTTYSDEYRQRIIDNYGASNLPETLEQVENAVDTTVNLGVGYPIRSFRPSLFAGKMWRRVCTEDTFEDHGCTPEKSTWNAGVSLGVYVTQALRLRVSYRISPSVRDDSKNTLDDQTSVGLSWGI